MLERLFASMALALIAGFAASSPWAAPFDGQTIRVQFWGGSDGLAIRRYIVAPFEKATGAKVVVEEGNTSASIAKARAQKADPQLDAILLDDIGVLTLAREGVLDKLDLAKLPNAADVHPTYVIGDRDGIGFFNYIVTVLYNEKRTAAPTSWADLWKPELKGKVLIPKITDTQGLLFTVMAARLNGGGIDNLAAAWPKLNELKPNIHSQIENRALNAEAIQSGEALYAVDIPYYFKPYIDRGYPIAMTTSLKEGFFSITGSAAIVKGGKGNRDVVYAFINQALSPEAQAGMARELWYGPTNPKAQIPSEISKFLVHTPEQYEKAIQVDRLKLLAERPDIIAKWNETLSR
jgi:putative spermidine/putrescine transport system substrate-binding protein